MKKKLKTTCCICNNSCDGKILIKDPRYSKTPDGSPCCHECFIHWQKCDDEYLIKKEAGK